MYKKGQGYPVHMGQGYKVAERSMLSGTLMVKGKDKVIRYLLGIKVEMKKVLVQEMHEHFRPSNMVCQTQTYGVGSR